MRSFYSLITAVCFIACQAGSQSAQEVVEIDPVAEAEARAQTARQILEEQHKTLEGYVVYACAAGEIPDEQQQVVYSLTTTFVSCSVFAQNQNVVFVPNPETDGMYCSYLFLGPQTGSANFVLAPLDSGIFTAMSFSMPRVSGDYGRQDWVQQAMYATDGTYTFSVDLQQRKEHANNGPHLSVAYRQAGQTIPAPKHVSRLDVARDVLQVGMSAMEGAEGAIGAFPVRRNRTIIRFHDFDFDAQEVDTSTAL
jgi:hypothetical protein